MSTFLAAESAPFLVATLILVAIAVVEGAGLVLGISPTHWLDGIVSDHVASHGAFETWLGWLHVGRAPLLALIVVFLGAFAVIGFSLNMVTHGLLGFFVPALIGAPLSVFAALPIVRLSGTMLGRIMPKDESSAVTLDSLIGRIATIVNGTARHNFPAQAKVISEHGQPIYLMVEPENADTSFANGEEVLLVRRVVGTKFQGIRNPKPELL